MLFNSFSACRTVARRLGKNAKAGSACALIVSTIGLAGFNSNADAALIYGVTPANNLFSFDSATPGTVNSAVAISGLQSNENILGIDFRPNGNVLYGLGSTGRLYTLNLNTGTATLASTLVADGTDATNPFTQLNGTDFGIDFNPLPDRLRVVSNTRQNLRINVDTGAVITDDTLNPGSPNVVAAAYTNPFVGAPSTTLYTIDAGTDVLNIQNPPNNGTQVSQGPLNVNVGAVGGMDIDLAGVAYAALTPTNGSITNLYTINLGTGNATLVGQIDGGFFVTDIAVVIPEPSAIALLGLGALGFARRRTA
jgi:hypothetical protein